ncbi:MAG: LPS export ABC transporter periplasmic protein LptC [Chitinophagales bacterium]
MTSLRSISVLSLLIAGSLLLGACQNSLEEAKLVTSRANVNLETGKDVEISFSENGKSKIKAYGKTVTRHITARPYLEFSEGMKIEFFNADGKVESVLTSRYATAIENSQQMTARDSVVVVNQKGERLDTDELIWDEEQKTIYSNTFVKITTADEIIYGTGMVANQNFSDYVIKHITGKIKVKASEM